MIKEKKFRPGEENGRKITPKLVKNLVFPAYHALRGVEDLLCACEIVWICRIHFAAVCKDFVLAL